MKKAAVNKEGRLDKYVTKVLPYISRANANKLIEQGKVLVNGQVSKSSHRLVARDTVTINDDHEHIKEPAKLKLPILYQDNDCLVINKPVGILSHSKGVFNPEPTVATWLKPYLKEWDDPRAGIVHRLDRITSGVMICAKNIESFKWLQKQFSARKTNKTYIAIVQGLLKHDEAIIDMPIERNPKKPQKFRVSSRGKTATTAYKLLKTNGELSMLELKPTTGRTHQLRVHLSHIGHPILGDIHYGGKKADRVFLHALSLEIALPSKERKLFTAPLPEEFNIIK